MKFPILLLSFFFAPVFALAADDTFSCLSSFSGPTVTMSANGEYTDFMRDTWTANTRFDARNAWWRHQTVPDKPEQHNWLVSLGPNWQGNPGPAFCFAGGLIVGTNDPNGPWGAVKSAAGAGMHQNAEGAVLDGIRMHNVGEDGTSLNWGTWRVKDSWLTGIWADAIENDLLAPGKVEDSFIEALVPFSIDPGTDSFNDRMNRASHIMEISGVLAKMKSFNMSDRPYGPWGNFIKARNEKDRVELRINNSIFATAGWPTEESAVIRDWTTRQARAWTWVTSCSNNLLLWLSDAPIPGHFPYPPSRCFTVKKGQEARNIWNAAVTNWINCHPKLQRLPGDPPSDFSKCDTSAYGGGGTPTAGGTSGGGAGTTSGGAGDTPVVGDCETYASGSVPPQGYGAAWNVHTATRQLLLSAYCHASGQTDLYVGRDVQGQYIYKNGYYYSNGWKPFTMTGTFVQGSTDWLLGHGKYAFAQPPAREFFWVGYICQWAGAAWKCGCRDAACTQPYWQLQGVKR